MVASVLMMANLSVASAKTRLDITFQDFQNPEFINISDLLPSSPGHLLLLAFWDRDCPPCVVELATLPDLANRFPDIEFAAVATGDINRSRQWVRRHPLPKGPVKMLISIGDTGIIMRQMGNLTGAYPFSAAITPEGKVCAFTTTKLEAKHITAMKKLCTN
jgi:thiol-disulfide isomerase/thioredoxin